MTRQISSTEETPVSARRMPSSRSVERPHLAVDGHHLAVRDAADVSGALALRAPTAA